MPKQGTVIIVDDNRAILTAVELLLTKHFEKVITLNSPKMLITTLRENPQTDIILLDMNFTSGINTGNEGFYWLNQIKSFDADIQVVLFTAYGDIELAIRAIRDGAMDFILKPWDNDQLVAKLLSAYNLRHSAAQLSRHNQNSIQPQPMYWGLSESMLQLKTMVEKVASTDANILITGENGTGKEMLAREIHNRSHRSAQPLVTVDMGALTETLFESELFGHVKGSFTDAKVDRAGKFEAAHRGTLFLDEIGNLPFHLQAKLLTALQSRSVVPVGGNQPIPVDIRLISATNRNLIEMVNCEKFRDDLLYRVNTIQIHIPSLRERIEDIVPLAKIFLAQYAKKYNKTCTNIESKAEQKLRLGQWAGNIRELQHTIEKAVIMSEGSTLLASELNVNSNEMAQVSSAGTLEDMEREMIRSALRVNQENLSAAASSLGITRQTLYNKMKKYNL